MIDHDDALADALDRGERTMIDGAPDHERLLSVEVNGHASGDAVVEGIPDDILAEINAQRAAAGGRNHQDSDLQQAAQQTQSQSVAASTATDASATTDPHHDQGSAATGHVEDASPDTHGAGPPEEAPHEPEPEPETHVEPAHEEPVAVVAEETHDTSTATPEHDHS